MLHLGIVKTFDNQNHRAGVQLAGSLTTYLDDISVSVSIPSSAMVVGNYVLVAIPGGNPRDACVVASWPAGSSGGGGGSKIQDADGDTYLWVEKTADEDKIHGVVKDVEALLLDDVGILTLAKQSAARAYYTGAKYYIKDRTVVKVRLNTVDYDIQGEFDSTEKTGTTTAGTAYHLIDITKSQFVAADVGRTVWNAGSNVYATVTAYNSTSDLTIDANIFGTGASYYLYAGRFTAKVAGLYVVTATVRYYPGQDKMHAQCRLIKNGASWATFSLYQSSTNGITIPNNAIAFLEVNDYLELCTWNDSSASQQQFDNASGSCWMAVAKVA